MTAVFVHGRRGERGPSDYAFHDLAHPQEFEGVGHWWTPQAPDRAASLLQEFWGSRR